jgi:hypothetical protein
MPEPTIELLTPVRTRTDWLERQQYYLDHAFTLVLEMREEGKLEAIAAAASFLNFVASDPWTGNRVQRLVDAFGEAWVDRIDWGEIDGLTRRTYSDTLDTCRKILEGED